MTNQEADYAAAVQDYDKQSRLADEQRGSYGSIRDILLWLATIPALLLTLSLLPWSRWIGKAAEVDRRMANESKKMFEVGVEDLRAMREPSPIIGRKGLKTYSIADELTKWNDLLNNGVVTVAEFEEARARLLSNSTLKR